MYMLSLCCVRDHDVCLMQCVWNDVPLLCMIGSVVQAHGKKKGNNGDPNLETRSVRFVKHWPSNQQWATSLIKLNLCRCLCPYIRVYRCRHECTYMRTCVCMYICIYIHSCMWMLTHVIRVLCNTSSCEPICNMCNIENNMRWEPIGSCWSFFTIGLPSATCAYVK